MKTGSISCIRRYLCVRHVYTSVIIARKMLRKNHFPHFAEGREHWTLCWWCQCLWWYGAFQWTAGNLRTVRYYAHLLLVQGEVSSWERPGGTQEVGLSHLETQIWRMEQAGVPAISIKDKLIIHLVLGNLCLPSREPSNPDKPLQLSHSWGEMFEKEATSQEAPRTIHTKFLSDLPLLEAGKSEVFEC